MAELRDVFVPGGMPSYTYQDRSSLDLEGNLQSALRRLRKFISVAGPTKCGKTVLVRKIIPKDKGIWIEGGQVSSISDFWGQVLTNLEVPSAITLASSKSVDSAFETEDVAGFKPGGIGAETKNKQSDKTSLTQSKSRAFESSPPNTAVEALITSKKTLVIDDFHYIDQATQQSVVRGLKQAVFDGLQVVLILIPHRMHQAAKAEMDVDGRTHTIEIPEWQPNELFAIADTGFRVLGVRAHANTITTMVDECFKSPHLMQDFCSQLCDDSRVYETNTGPLKTLTFLKGEAEFFTRHAKNAVNPETFRAIQKGPDRTNRLERKLKGGGTCDTYEAVLIALKNLDVMSPVKWADLRKGLQEILVDEPQQHEITRVLEKMDEIAKSRQGEPVIDYVKEERELHLVDPFFRFYVRWGSMDHSNRPN